MKKTSIIFSGFMGALLLSYGARAADAQIASKQYVDNKETAIMESVSNTYETKENVTNLQQTVTQLSTTVNDPESGLSSKIDSVEQGLSDTNDTVSALGVTVEGKEDKSNKAASISEQNQSSPDLYPSVGAIVEWTNDKINKLSETGIPVNPDNIGENAITTEKIANGAVTTDKIADDAVTEDKLGTDVVSKIDGKEDKSNKIQAITPESTSDQYPSAVAVRDALDTKLDSSELSNLATKAELGDYATTEAMTSALDAKADKTAIDDMLTKTEASSTYATQEAIADMETKTDAAATYATKDELGSYATIDALNLKEDKANMVQTIRSALEAEETKYTSEKAVATALESKADTTALDSLATKEELAQKADATDLDAYATTEAMNSALANKADSSALTDGLALKEDVANKRIVVRDAGTATDTDYPSEKAVRTELDKKADKGTTLAEYGITDAYTKGETDTKISEAVTGSIEGDFGPALAGKEDTSNRVATIDSSNENATDKYTSVKAVVDYVIPKPDITCQAESNLCVLSVDRDGNIAWVNVTNPAN